MHGFHDADLFPTISCEVLLVNELRDKLLRGVKNYDQGVNDTLKEVGIELDSKMPTLGMLFMFFLSVGFIMGMAFMAYLIFM